MKKIFEGTSALLDPFVIGADNQIEYKQSWKDILSQESRQCKDSVALKLDLDNWKYNSKPCFISAKNVSTETINATISIKGMMDVLRIVEVNEVDVLDSEILKKYNIFLKAFNNIDGSRLSHKERNEKKIVGSEFTYGEVHFLHFLPILHFTVDTIENQGKTKPVLWDLGCGAGKVLITAALSGRLSKIYGIELLDELCDAGKKACSNFEKIMEEEKLANDVKLEVIKSNMLEVDWSNADIVYMSSICFPEPLMKGIIKKASHLKKGSLIASLKMIDDENFKFINSFRIRMTWGICDVQIMEKNN